MRSIKAIVLSFLLSFHSFGSTVEVLGTIPVTLIANCFSCTATYGGRITFKQNEKFYAGAGILGSYFSDDKYVKTSQQMRMKRPRNIEATEVIVGGKYLFQEEPTNGFITLYLGKGIGSARFEKEKLHDHGRVQFTTLRLGVEFQGSFDALESLGFIVGVTESFVYHDDTSDYPSWAEKKRFVITIPTFLLGLYYSL